MDAEMLARVNNAFWYHEFDFGEGIRTKPWGAYGTPAFQKIWTATRKFLDRVDFRNKRVLDIGCWDGYWSFYAEQRGAQDVLATDDNSQRLAMKGHDIVVGGTASDNEGFRIAHEMFRSRVEYRGDVDVYRLSSLNRRFDRVLFLGVYYHLTTPMLAFAEIRHSIELGGEAIIEGCAINDAERSFMEFYYGNERSDGPEEYRLGSGTKWCLPSRRCLRDMVTCNYFEIVDEYFPPEVPAKGFGRFLIRARAVEREDAKHKVRPPLGLHQYDPRFKKAGEVGGMFYARFTPPAASPVPDGRERAGQAKAGGGESG